jgi:hypothetical protein
MFPDKWTWCRRLLTLIFRLPLIDDVSEGIWRSDGVGGWRGVVKQTMADEARWEIKIFVNKSKYHPKTSLPSTYLTLFFHPPPAVDIYERPRGSDWVEVGRGEGGGWCHGGGEGQHEVSPHLVSAKSLVSISKIHVLPSNLHILSPRMLATCCA